MNGYVRSLIRLILKYPDMHCSHTLRYIYYFIVIIIFVFINK